MRSRSSLADPFANVRMGSTGFEQVDLPYLAPYMAAAVGVALGATRPKDRRIDLTPLAKRTSTARNPKRFMVGVGAVVLVGATGAYFMHGRSAIADEQDKLATATAQLSDLQGRIAQRDAAADPTAVVNAAGSTAGAAEVAGSVAGTDIDWIAVQGAVTDGGAPLGIVVTSFQGVFEPPPPRVVVSPVTDGVVDPAAPSGPVEALPVETASQAPLPLGTLTLSATAPSLLAVADWLDSIASDTRFTDAWASGLTMIAQVDGPTLVQFTMVIALTEENLVDRAAALEVPA